MITDIPTAADFKRAALSSLNLAWRVSLDAIREYESYLGVYYGQDDATGYRRYLEGSQTSLGNALTLIQQAVEFGLKGKIADFSPFLLIGRDARDLPSGSTSRDVSFAEFRTIDAVDLVRVHDTVCTVRLTDEFKITWEALRQQRNTLMHTVAPGRDIVKPEALLLVALKVHKALFNDMSFPQRRLGAYRGDDGDPVLWEDGDGPVTLVMGELEVAIRSITKSDCKRLLGFDPSQRHYYCAFCYGSADSEWFKNCEDGVPHYATLTSRAAGCRTAVCLVCEKVSQVQRVECTDPGCPGTVQSAEPGYEGQCLTCGHDEQDVRRAAEWRARYPDKPWSDEKTEPQ